MFFFLIVSWYRTFFFLAGLQNSPEHTCSTKNIECYNDWKAALFFKGFRYPARKKWIKKQDQYSKFQSLILGVSSHVNHFLSHRISAMQLLSVYVYRQIIKKYFFYNKSVYGAYEFSTSQRWHLLKKVVSKLSSQFYYPCHLGTRFSLQYSRISFWCMLRSSKSYSFLSSFPFYVRDSNLLPADILSSLPFGSFLFKKKQYSSLNSGWFFVFLLRVIIGFTLFSGRLFSRCIRVHISTKMKSLSSHIQTKKYSLRASGEEFMHTAELDFCYDDISQDVLFKGNLFVRYKLRSCISSNLSSSNKKVSHNVNLNTFSSFFDQCLKQVSHTSRPYGQSNFRLMGSSCFFRGTNAFLVSIVNSLSLVDLGVGAYPRCQYLNRGALFYVFYFVLFLIWKVCFQASLTVVNKKQWILHIFKALKSTTALESTNLLVLEGWLSLWFHYTSTGAKYPTFAYFCSQFSVFCSRFFFIEHSRRMVERGPCGYKFQSTKLSSFSCNESFLKTMFVSSQNMGNHFYIVHLLKGPSGFFLIHGKSDISKRFVRFSCGVHFKGSWYSALSPELRYLHFWYQRAASLSSPRRCV